MPLFQVQSGSGSRNKKNSTCPERNSVLGEGCELAGGNRSLVFDPARALRLTENLPLTFDRFRLLVNGEVPSIGSRVPTSAAAGPHPADI